MSQATEQRQLRFVDADELRGWTNTLEGVAIMSVNDDVIGGLDGLLVDEDDRPLYLAIVAREPAERRYLLPIGTTWFDETAGVVRTDTTRETLAQLPLFTASDYQQMSPEDSWAYEQRVLRACCPETLARPGSRLEHYNRKHFQHSGWLKRPATGNADTSRPKR